MHGKKGVRPGFLFLLLVCLVAVALWGQRTLTRGGDDPGWGCLPRAVDPLPPPEPVPYLVSSPSPADGQGRVEVDPPGPFLAGSVADFQITYTTGRAGVAPGGFVLLQVSPWWGWSEPQTRDPSLPGYTVVETSAPDPPRVVRTLPHHRVQVVPGPSGLRPGDTVTFRFGRARVDRYAEDEERFQVFVDGDGDGHAAEVADTPMIRILAGEPVRLNVTVCSQVVPGAEARILVAPLDEVGNRGRLPPGRYTVRVIRDGQPVEERVRDEAGGDPLLSLPYTPDREGIYFFEASGPSGLAGRSNVLLCQKGEPSLKRYFGDIHGHSRLSDGTGTPEAFYRYAREVSGLDIAALTDHGDHGTIRIRGEVWARIAEAAERAYDPGRFVTFLGFEWTSWEYGHRNVYYRDGKGPVFRSFDPESDTPEKLWQLLDPHEAMTVAHHVGGGPAATDWSVASGPKEWLVEICSIHGSSEAYGGRASIHNPAQGSFVQDALRLGYRLGFIGSGDTHDGHPGQRSTGARVGGLLGVYSPELTREAVWEAFRKRHVYATSGPKIILHFRAGDAPMGSRVTWPSGGPDIPLALRAVGCRPVTEVEILRNGEPVFRWTGEEDHVLFFPGDPVPPAGVHWYYTRVTQEDGNMAWSSPVWVDVQ